jgi:hypothetical protein
MACIPVYKGKRFPSTEKLLQYLSTEEGIMAHLADGKDTEFLKAIEGAVSAAEKSATPEQSPAQQIAATEKAEKVKISKPIKPTETNLLVAARPKDILENLDRYSLDQLVKMLKQNDPNGIYDELLDEENEIEAKETAKENVKRMFEDYDSIDLQQKAKWMDLTVEEEKPNPFAINKFSPQKTDNSETKEVDSGSLSLVVEEKRMGTKIVPGLKFISVEGQNFEVIAVDRKTGDITFKDLDGDEEAFWSGTNVQNPDKNPTYFSSIFYKPTIAPQSPAQQIADLRAKEQAELDSKIKDADKYRGADGKVDRDKLTNDADRAAFDEVYERYNGPISKLLGKEPKPKAGSLRDVELTMRRPEKNEVIFVPIDALLEKQAADQPSYDIQKEGNRIKGRVEKAKQFLKNYLKDQRAINPKTGKRTNAKVSFEPSVVDIDADGKISFEDGRHRVLAAKELGLTEVPIEVPKGKGKAIQESLKQQQTTKTKGKESPKAIDRKATQALLDQANDELAAAKSAFDKKKAELNKTTKEDAPDLFGKRKVESGQGLFEMPRINPAQREKAIQPFRDRFEKAKAEVNRLTTLLNEGQEVTQELKFESDEQVQTTGTEVRKGKGGTKDEGPVRKKTPPVRNAGRTPDAIAARNVQFFGDPYYSSLQYVMDMTYHPDLLQSIFGGPDKNAKSGRKNIEGERKSRIQFLDKKSNIKTADRLGELLAEKYAEDNNISVREAEEKHNFRDIAETIILNHNSRNQMVKAILDQNDMVENQYKFQYDPEGIYGEDFNEDAAKDVDNSLDDIPDSYWEGMDLTDEQYNELFAPESESPFTDFQTKGEAGRKAREALKERVGKSDFAKMELMHKKAPEILKGLEERGVIKIECP